MQILYNSAQMDVP